MATINRTLERGAEQLLQSWIEAGRQLIDAREALKDNSGEWSRLIGANGHMGLLSVKKTHVARLVSIAENADKLSPHVGILPQDTHSVSDLAKLPAESFPRLIESGVINPEMTRAQAKAEVQKVKATAKRADIPTENKKAKRAVA